MSGTPALDLTQLKAIRARIAPHIHRTPIFHSATLSRMSGFEVFLKAELLQKTGSYKPRGMLWALTCTSAEQRARGFITFSAGNAAQGLAYAAGIIGAKAVVVMPAAASPAKAQATRDYGAEVILHGATGREAFARCREIASERDLIFQPSYDDLPLMQGHATMGLEIIEDVPDLDAILLGVGGGGMLGGVTLALSAAGHKATILGVEPEGAPAMHRSFAAGKAVTLDQVNTVADGLAAPSAGTQCFELVRERVQSILLASDAQILEGLRLLMERCKLYAEPAGAAPIAGLLSGRTGLKPGARVACVVSGGNLDLPRLKLLFP